MPARGWLQRVRHNTYTVCYVRLVADHHLLVVPHSPRPAHLIRTVILHNCYGPGIMKTSRSGAGGAFPSYDDFSEDDKRSNGINSIIAKYFAPTGLLALLILRSIVAPAPAGDAAIVGGGEHIHVGSFGYHRWLYLCLVSNRTHLSDCTDVVAQLLSRVKRTSCDNMDLSCQHNTDHMLYLEAAGAPSCAMFRMLFVSRCLK